MWIERSILRNMTIMFGILAVYVATQPLVGGYFSLMQLAVCCLGVLLPPIALCRLNRNRSKVSILVRLCSSTTIQDIALGGNSTPRQHTLLPPIALS